MNAIDFKMELYNQIMDMRPRKKVNDMWSSVRCPFCGDSRKSLESTHFYVKINFRDDEPVFFICHRCDTSGIMTPSVLRSLDINDLALNSGLVSYNKIAMKNMKHTLGIINNNLDFTVPVADENDERNIFKKKYFDKRLEIDTTFEELAELKVIFKLGQFLRHNDIEKITVPKDKGQELHDKYLGFLTSKNEFINFRQVYDSKFRRYEKYSLFKNLDNTRKFYTIPNSVDLLTNKKITINIAEGAFDILGVYYHIFAKEKKNMIYTAVCGAGYVSVIKYFIKMGVIDNVDVNIFSDDDRHPNFYKALVRELSPWVNDINLFYNEKSKDFGMPKRFIKTVKKRI